MRLLPRPALVCALLALTTLTLPACEAANRRVKVVERNFDLEDIEHLSLDQRAGDLVIVGEEGRDSVTLVVELRHSGVSDRRDERAIKALRIGLDAQSADSGRLIAGLDSAPNNYYVDVTAFVPTTVTMDIEDDSGDVEIDNIAEVTIRDGSGDLDIHRVPGDVEVTDGSGDLAIASVGGDVEVFDSSGDLDISGVGGGVYIEDRSGDIGVSSVDGTVTISDGSGDIYVRDAGKVDILENGSGDIDV